MLPTAIYLLKSCVYVIAFYIPFALILRRTTFFHVNRFYLVSGLLLSLLLPLYAGFPIASVRLPVELPLWEPIVSQAQLVVTSASEAPASSVMLLIIFSVYLLGAAFRLISVALSAVRIIRMRQRAVISAWQNVRIVKADTPIPFSFFNYVFMPVALEDPGITAHEAAHVRQRHWIDLLIAELVSIALWFNPVMIVYKRALKLQHEYLADRSAISTGVGVRAYLVSISKQLTLTSVSPLVNAFNVQSIKNRISMLTTKRTSVFVLAAYTLVLPLVVCALIAFSPRVSLKLAHPGPVGFVQNDISLGLPIDKANIDRLESGYGERLHPVLKVKRLHTGIDLVAAEGVPVVSTEDGLVVKAKVAHAWGNIIVIQHKGPYLTSYSHLKSMDVKEGEQVKKGQTIGLVGNTGLASQFHLHFELLKDGKAIDPMGYLPEMN